MNGSKDAACIDRSAILPLIDRSTLLVAEKAANLQLEKDSRFRQPAAPCRAVRTTTTDDCRVRLALYAGEQTMHRIADGMLGGPAMDAEEFEEAVKEFFNVLCGHIVSEAARRYHASIFFPPPDFPQDPACPPENGALCMSFAGASGEQLCIVCE